MTVNEQGFEVIDLDEWEWLADYEDGVFTLVCYMLMAMCEERTRWVWVAHKVWATEDPSPLDARSYPLRLAEQWHPGLSYHDGRFWEEEADEC